MFQRPFRHLAVFLVATILSQIFLPLAVFIGYPWLLIIGVALLLKSLKGEIKSPGQTAFLWAIYLGFVMILHGVTICSDSALAGAPPSEEQKRFGNGLAYLGAAIAGISAIAAYLLELARRAARSGGVPAAIDDH